MIKLKDLSVALVAIAAFSPAATAQSRSARAVPAYRYQSDAALIEAAAERAQHEPGVTHEFSPDARQTASGGPSGGIPNQSGGP